MTERADQTERLTQLSELPGTALITVGELARLLNRSDEAVRRAIERGELPPPIPLCSKRYWMVRRLLTFLTP
jgi:hypothetical protein